MAQNIVAAKYQQTTSRATPESVQRELRKLPASAGPMDSRKRALHDLAHALAYVQKQHEAKVVEVCKNENAAQVLIQLLDDVMNAPPVPPAEDVIRVGRRTLGMGPMESKLYIFSCFVNLCYLGGAGMMRLPPPGGRISAMELLIDALLQTNEAAGGESLIFYSVAGLYNLSNHVSFAEAAAKKPGTLQKLESLASSPNPDTVKYSTGCIQYWRRHHVGSWPPH